MKLKRIELEAIGCYRKAHFDFPDLTVIYGENRTGKSTLVHGIFFGLFGEHLQEGLIPVDLCRKGAAEGGVTLFFENEKGAFKLFRSTAGGAMLYRFVQDRGEDPWAPMSVYNGGGIESRVGVPAQVAALTSFFQEGELLFFLRHAPRYGRTLLQHIIDMDEVFVVQSRFKKALSLAKEAHDRAERRVKADVVDPVMRQATADRAEKRLREIEDLEAAHRRLLEGGKGAGDPDARRLLERRCVDAETEFQQVREAPEARTASADLEAEKRRIKARVADAAPDAALTVDLERQMGALEGKTADAGAFLERLNALGDAPVCSTCGQAVTPEGVASVKERIHRDLSLWAQEREALGKRLAEQKAREAAFESDRRRLEAIDRELEACGRWRSRHERATAAVMEAREALSRYGKTHVEVSLATGDGADAIKALEARLSSLRQQLIDDRVALGQLVETERRARVADEERMAAERDRRICQVAHKAIEDAVAAMNRELMGRVKESLGHWGGQFSFLEGFDVAITPHQFIPVIQARGYGYKLNQMSKSERIFLYLMLKLAIGDALSHLGVFVLDDPADGLDTKRKGLMAALLKEVALRRQVIVTTNDPEFAGCFPEEARLTLTPAG